MRHAITILMAIARWRRSTVLWARCSIRQPDLMTRCQSSIRQRRQYQRKHCSQYSTEKVTAINDGEHICYGYFDPLATQSVPQTPDRITLSNIRPAVFYLWHRRMKTAHRLARSGRFCVWSMGCFQADCKYRLCLQASLASVWFGFVGMMVVCSCHNAKQGFFILSV